MVLNGADEDDDAIRLSAARCAGGLGSYLEAVQVSDIIFSLTDRNASRRDTARAGRLLVIGSILQAAGQRAVEARDDAFEFLKAGMECSNGMVKAAACRFGFYEFSPGDIFAWKCS